MASRADIKASVFPARAGVIPRHAGFEIFTSSVPRASGGDPSFVTGVLAAPACSPRERG